MTKYVIYLSEEGIIDYSAVLTMIEDILETYPIRELEIVFELFEGFLKSKPNVSIIIIRLN